MRHDSCSHQNTCSRRNEWFYQSRRKPAVPKEDVQKETKDTGIPVIDPNPMLGEL